MPDRHYLYRRGDGNEGNFVRAVVVLKERDSPWAALRALVVNDYIVGGRVRRRLLAELELDGKEDHVHATLHEGPKGETAFGAAYITAELTLLDEKDVLHYRDRGLYTTTIREGIDRGARKVFNTFNKRDA